MEVANTGPRTQNINHGRDQNIHNGQGDMIINAGDEGATVLWNVIAGVGASHDAEQQFSRGDCLPGTREKAIAVINEWATSAEWGNPPVCWVSGAVGVGKTVIAMTIAKACAANKSLVNSFFFFRSDPKRNNPSFLFLCIAHGLATSIPSLRRVIGERISIDRRILESQLEEQFRELVLKPFFEIALNPSTSRPRQIPQSATLKQLPPSLPPYPSAGRSKRAKTRAIPNQSPLRHDPKLVVIDGLDECSDSETQLRILSAIFSAFKAPPYPPLQFLVFSRPEAWIREALYSQRFRPLSKHVMLDKEFHAGEDIEQYLLHEFDGITTSPKYRHIAFPKPWPSRDVVACLVQYSCGQFIYVVTVMKWIKADGFHPIEQLRIILKQSPRQAWSSPYRPLDNLYHIILSIHPDPETLRHVLAAILFLPLIPNLRSRYDGGQVATPEFIEWVLGLSAGQVLLTLRSMHSVLHVEGSREQMHVHHTSFRDFLCDNSRSGDFFLDEHRAQYFLLRQWLRGLMVTCLNRLDPTYSESDGRLLPVPYIQLWEGWLAFAEQVPHTPTEVLCDLETMDLSAPFTLGLSEHGGADSWRRWFEILKKITSWLTIRSQGNDVAYRVINRFERLQKHFHVAVPNNLATPTFLENLSTWMSLVLSDASFGFHPVTCHTSDAVRHYYLIMSQQNSKWRILIDTECTCPTSVLHSSGEAMTPIPSKPNSGYAHLHVNLPVACVSTLRALATSLEDEIDSGTLVEGDWLVVDVIRSRLISRCPSGDLHVLSVFRRFLSLVADLKARTFLHPLPRKSSMEIKSWLEGFSEEYKEEVEDVWRKYTAVVPV